MTIDWPSMVAIATAGFGLAGTYIKLRSIEKETELRHQENKENADRSVRLAELAVEKLRVLDRKADENMDATLIGNDVKRDILKNTVAIADIQKDGRP